MAFNFGGTGQSGFSFGQTGQTQQTPGKRFVICTRQCCLFFTSRIFILLLMYSLWCCPCNKHTSSWFSIWFSTCCFGQFIWSISSTWWCNRRFKFIRECCCNKAFWWFWWSLFIWCSSNASHPSHPTSFWWSKSTASIHIWWFWQCC